MERHRRGRLSAMDQVPEHAQDDIMWACAELGKRQRTQADILFELNDRLAVKGVDPVSATAFNRKAAKLAALNFRREEYRFIASGLDLTSLSTDEASVALGETIKMLIFELSQDGDVSPKSAMELARGYQAVVMAQHKSSSRYEEELEKGRKLAGAAIDAVAARKGLSEDMKVALRAELFGKTPEKAAATSVPSVSPSTSAP